MQHNPHLRKFRPATESRRALIPTGIAELDDALGGIPFGLTELFGTAGGGKTTLLCWLAAHFQQRNFHDISKRQIAWIDAENAFDPDYATLLGVDLSGVVICRPADMEEAITSIEACIKEKYFDLVIVDSIPSIFGDDRGKDVVNDILEQRLPIWNMQSLRVGKLVAITNHVVDVQRHGEVAFGNPLQPASGLSLRHFAALSLRIEKCCWKPEETTTELKWGIHKARQVVNKPGGTMTIRSSAPVVKQFFYSKEEYRGQTEAAGLSMDSRAAYSIG